MKSKKPVAKQRRSVILALGLVLLGCFTAVVCIDQQIDINKLTQEHDAIVQKLEEQENKNDELSAIVENGDEKEYIERIAREKYGYVKPEEKVFYDISASN